MPRSGVCFRYKELSGADQHAEIVQSDQCILSTTGEMLASSMGGPRKFCQRGSTLFVFYLDQNSSTSRPSFAFRMRTDLDDGPIALCFLGNPY